MGWGFFFVLCWFVVDGDVLVGWLVFMWHLSSFCLPPVKMINLNSEDSPDCVWALAAPQRSSKSGSA